MSTEQDPAKNIGVPLGEADYVFLLPNKPILPLKSMEEGLVAEYVSELINLNGNHWRKILTIMSKLTVPKLEDWRQWRDEMLSDNVTIIFDAEQLNLITGITFIVGNGFRDEIVIADEATTLGQRHVAFLTPNYIWCPYLDYRQFPNVLIDELRHSINNNIPENACFKP